MWAILKNHGESISSVMPGLGRESGGVGEVRENSDGRREVSKCSCQVEREVRSGEPHARVQGKGKEESLIQRRESSTTSSDKLTDPKLILITQSPENDQNNTKL